MAQGSGSFITSVFYEIVESPINIALVFLIAFLVYKILKSRQNVPAPAPPEPQLPRLRRDFTIQELKKYDGTGEDGRVLVAVNGNVYDVTKGKRFYGPGKKESIVYNNRTVMMMSLMFTISIFIRRTLCGFRRQRCVQRFGHVFSIC